MTLKEKYDMMLDKHDEMVVIQKALELNPINLHSIICLDSKKEVEDYAKEFKTEVLYQKWNDNDEVAGEYFFEYRGIKFFKLIYRNEVE